MDCTAEKVICRTRKINGTSENFVDRLSDFKIFAFCTWIFGIHIRTRWRNPQGGGPCAAKHKRFTMPYQLTNYVPDLCAAMVSNLLWEPYPQPRCPIKNGCQLEHTRRRPCENPCSSRTRRCHFSPFDGSKGQKHAGHQTEVPLFWHNCLTHKLRQKLCQELSVGGGTRMYRENC